MLLVLLTEWFSLYVPALTNFASLLLERILPQSEEDDLYRRPMKKLSRKERILQNKYDDQLALQQLKGLDKKAAKYSYVSDDFLQRHELGSYSKTKLKSLNDVTSLIGKSSRSIKETGLNVAEEDDANWVVEALTATKESKPRPFFQPSIGLSSNNGASVGIEFGFGSSDPRRSAIAQALATDERRRHRSPPREKSSTKDSLLDKFRDLTGTDSVMLSRSLLGAYPGDAVSIQDAASPEGVTELARRYGWGEWSEDDEEEDMANWNSDEIDATPKRKRIRRKTSQKRNTVEPKSSADIDLDFDDFSSMSQKFSNAPNRNNAARQRKPTVFPSRKRREEAPHRPIQLSRQGGATSPILQRGIPATGKTKSARMIRPAMELLTDRREQLLQKLNEETRKRDE